MCRVSKNECGRSTKDAASAAAAAEEAAGAALIAAPAESSSSSRSSPLQPIFMGQATWPSVAFLHSHVEGTLGPMGQSSRPWLPHSGALG